MRAVIAAVALAAAIFAISPASARMTCSGADMMKANSMMMTMPPSEQKDMMNREFFMANTAMNKGDMRGCNKSMRKMEKMSMMKKGM